jgi:SAM-dependent methyltransferase
MKRETTNAIRTVLEEWLPPVVRDSSAMRWLFRQHWGRLVDDLESFRTRIAFISDEEYHSIYERLPRVQDETDNSEACIAEISKSIVGGTVLDVGCGTGYLVDHLAKDHPRRKFTGLDFIIEEGTRTRSANIKFVEGKVEALPFADKSFDTVICTHVLEHVLDLAGAVRELRRVAQRRLIIVVPQEREYRFTFNPHVHFFPYPHSFLRYMTPVPTRYRCESVGRDFYYVEVPPAIATDAVPAPSKKTLAA